MILWRRSSKYYVKKTSVIVDSVNIVVDRQDAVVHVVIQDQDRDHLVDVHHCHRVEQDRVVRHQKNDIQDHP